MNLSEKKMAGDAAYNLPDETSRMILLLAQDRLKALQGSGTALDARTTQVAAIQLAAAAFSGGLVAGGNTSVLSSFLAALGCLFFVIGSGVAFVGIRSCEQQVAGIEPSWWYDAVNIKDFTDKMARAWAVEATEEMIKFARVVDGRRAEYLNRSLAHGIVAGALVSSAAFVRLWVMS